MSRVELRAPDDAALARIALDLRRVDRAEIAAAHGVDASDSALALRVLRASVTVSQAPGGECFVAWAGGEPIAALGCAPVSLLQGLAAPWLLGTDKMRLQRRAVVALSRQCVARWARAWPQLVNHAHADNAATLRWLARLGFEIDPPTPWGARGERFCRFAMVRV